MLEDRSVPATITVTNLNDLGAGSLRQAIADSNGTAAVDTIVFQPGLTGTITLATQLNVTDPVTITGPGAGALTISGNNVTRIFLVNNGSTAIQNFAFSGMTLTLGLATGSNIGGAIQVDSEDLTLSNMVITNNKAQQGGGIAVTDGLNGRLTLVNSTVSNNQATVGNGGGLYLGSNSLTVVRNSIISGNTTVLSGGGIQLGQAGFLTVEGSTISGNQALPAGGGGGILAQADPNTTLVVRNSTISGNLANDGGGILMGGDGSLTVENSTLSGNRAARDGGGISTNGTTAFLRNSTIAFNTADSDNAGGGVGGGIFDTALAPTRLTLQSTLVAENLRGPTVRDDISATVLATSKLNLIGVNTGLAGITHGTNGNQVGTAGVPLNPMLGLLANNGGATHTHALLAGSPAIDFGFNFSGQGGDQRGGAFVRSFSATDVGAFEAQPPPPPAPPSPPPLSVVEIKVKRVGGRTQVDVLVNGVRRRRFFPFGAFKGRVQVQRVDVNGDRLLDLIARATINGKNRTRTFVT